MHLIDFIRGEWTLLIKGTFCERIINIAKENRIFIRDIKMQSDSSLIFTVSRKAFLILSSLSLPDEIQISVIEKKGLPAVFENNSKRYFLFIAPFFVFILVFLSTHIIWHVNIIDSDPQTEKFLTEELALLGVKKGAFTFLINQSDVKNKMLIKHEKLQWIWVDIKGGTALVRYSLRTMPPQIFDKDTFYNVYASHDGIITRIEATHGTSCVKVGEQVFKDDLLIEGIMPKDSEQDKYIHASGHVFATSEFTKTVTVPQKKEIRTPTGENFERLAINFKNFRIKLFINSSILYPKYDIIEYNRNISFLPVVFTKQVIKNVTVSYVPTDLESEKSALCSAFTHELESSGKKVTYIETFTSENGDECTITARAICEFDIAEERRINIGENYTIANS